MKYAHISFAKRVKKTNTPISVYSVDLWDSLGRNGTLVNPGDSGATTILTAQSRIVSMEIRAVTMFVQLCYVKLGGAIPNTFNVASRTARHQTIVFITACKRSCEMVMFS